MKCSILLVAALLAALQPAAGATLTEVHYVMGTYLRITADGVDEAHTRTALQRCFTTARELDARFSRFDRQSELSHLNATAAAGGATTVSLEMAALLRAAQRLGAATDGAFDVGAGALTHLWRTTVEWPDADSIARARDVGGSGAFEIAGSTLQRRPGVFIDVDGIAKGWAVDRCVAQLRGEGIARAFVSFGESSLYALGAPAATKGWEVTLRTLDGTHALGRLTLRDQAVSVSAVFGHERYIGSRRVGHIVDPRSGVPLTSPGLAVVLSPSATDAEAFSKALLITGGVRTDGAVGRYPTGALLVRPAHIKRFGHVAFTPLAGGPTIAAAAEPLR